MSNKPTIVGIGSASTKILNHIRRNEPDLKFLCIDNDEENLKNSYTRTLLFKDFASIGRVLDEENDIVVILPLGGNFGCDMGQYIIRYLINQNKDISVIATTPFTFEGKKRLSAARSTLKMVEDLVFDTTVFNNNSLLEKLEQQISLSDAFRIIDEIIYDTLKEKFLWLLITM